jgi:hypothetical protein
MLWLPNDRAVAASRDRVSLTVMCLTVLAADRR